MCRRLNKPIKIFDRGPFRNDVTGRRGGGGKQKWHIVTLGGGLVQVTHRFSIKKYEIFSLHFFIKYNTRVSYHGDESYTYINNFHNVEMFFFFPICAWFYSSSFSKTVIFRKSRTKTHIHIVEKKSLQGVDVEKTSKNPL